MASKNQDAAVRKSRREVAMAIGILFCVVVVGGWEFLAGRSRRPFVPFQITVDDLAGFKPQTNGWHVQQLQVAPSRIEPNIVSYLLRPATLPERGLGVVKPDATWSGALLVRLVHGYNMPDCMRIKGYEVELLADTRHAPRPEWQNRPIQVWRLTSAAGDPSFWVTSMLRVGDFLETDDDTRSMAFPRIGTPDDPNWLPRGIRLESFRHPIRNFRWLIHAKWNNARCDLGTFLKLKQPAWASDDLLTLVAATEDRIERASQATSALETAVAAHEMMSRSLRAWRTKQWGAQQEPAQGSADASQ